MRTVKIINCPKCKRKLRVPDDMGTLLITCPVCKHMFHHLGGSPVNNSNKTTVTAPQTQRTSHHTPQVTPRPASVSKPTPKPAPAPSRPAPKPQVPTRTLTVHRLMHVHKDLTAIGLKNMFVDAVPVQIYLDDVKRGVIKKEETLKFGLDSNAHILAHSPISGKHLLPAGNDSYEAFFFNAGFMIGIVEDSFRDELAQFVLKMVCGQGFKDRIRDTNNRYHAVKVSIHSEYIRVHWALNQTKGFAEWSTGEKEEKIYYSQIGLTPPPKSKRPGGYWEYLEHYVRDAVVCDPKADLQYGLGGFSFRQTHNLY